MLKYLLILILLIPSVSALTFSNDENYVYINGKYNEEVNIYYKGEEKLAGSIHLGLECGNCINEICEGECRYSLDFLDTKLDENYYFHVEDVGEGVMIFQFKVKAVEKKAVEEEKIVASTLVGYQCLGDVINSLCYYGSTPIKKEEFYEDNNLKIWFDYPLEVKVKEEFEFNLFIQNKLSNQLDITVIHDTFSNGIYETLFIPFTKEEIIQLNENEIKKVNAKFRAISPHISPNEIAYRFLRLSFTINPLNGKFWGKDFDFKNYVYPLEGIKCGNKIFPEKYMEGIKNHEYLTAKCCDNVFYPNFNCCSDYDCKEGKCIDGKCIAHMNVADDPAIGNKKVLLIHFGETTDENSCQNNPSVALGLITRTENFYDSNAKRYLNGDTNFINFDWEVYGTFKLEDLGFNSNDLGNLDWGKVVDKVSERCDIILEDYDEIILIGMGYLDIAGRAGRPITAGSPLDYYNNNKGNTIAHEIGHNFGCSDMYNLGGHLQWNNDLFGRSPYEKNTLQVCRGELGWVDLNGNGIIEVKEIKVEEEPDLGILIVDKENGPYYTIQSAIDSAQEGNIIQINPGLYHFGEYIDNMYSQENVKVIGIKIDNKRNLKIIGKGKTTQISRENGKREGGIRILDSEDISISNLYIKDAGHVFDIRKSKNIHIFNNEMENVAEGIVCIEDCDDSIFEDNVIKEFAFTGITNEGGSSKGQTGGFYINENNKYLNNKLMNTKKEGYGVFLTFTQKNTIVKGNSVIGANIGLSAKSIQGDVVINENNFISNNIGIRLWDSKTLKIFNNDLINNKKNAEETLYTAELNEWYNEGEGRGNYYSDLGNLETYFITDIEGNNINGDIYPLRCPFDEECKIKTCSECGKGLFNICDRKECNSIKENCYFEDWRNCISCNSMSCGRYLDENDCNIDKCNLDCVWDSDICIPRPKLRPCGNMGGFCSLVIINPGQGGALINGECPLDKRYCIICIGDYQKDPERDACIKKPKEPIPEPVKPPEEKLKGDFNNDGCVNKDDQSLFNANYGKEVDELTKKYDLNNDGKINFSDFILFSADYNKCI